MLVLHLGREAGCLEQPLAIPAERVGIGSEGDPGKTGGGIEFRLGDVDEQPFIDERQIARLQDFELVRFDLPIVFGMEDMVRSEEHTSELQSLMRISYAVFCLKKKKTIFR